MVSLHQPLSQPESFLLATMWIAGTPSDGMCYHQRTLPSVPDMLHMPSVNHTISQRLFGHITLVGYIPLKYYTYWQCFPVICNQQMVIIMTGSSTEILDIRYEYLLFHQTYLMWLWVLSAVEVQVHGSRFK